MRKVTIKSLMDIIIRMNAKLIGKMEVKDGNSALIQDGAKEKHINNLIKEGYTVLDYKLSPEKVDEIIKYSEKINCYDTYRDASAPIDLLNPPIETQVAYYSRPDLVKFKPILDIANDPAILQVVQEFLEAKPTISNINMWWSFGGRKQAEHAQLFHRDFDDWKFCKLFIYLTDVDENSGPHIYVRKSSASPKYRKIRRYSDEEIEKAFGKENILSFTATKGAAFMVDTYGFHKGLLPKAKNRLLLQIQYSMNPIGIENYTPLKVDKVQHNKYINRLLIDE